MGRKGFEKVSQREYARRLGVSNEAVSKAVRMGHIREGWHKAEKKIIVEKADREWGLMFRKTDVQQIIETSPGLTATPSKGGQSDTLYDHYQPTGKDDIYSGKQKGSLELTAGSSYGDARRVREIILAQSAALDLKQRKGELVNKEEVNKQLFATGQQLRVNLMAIPDRTIDDILASKSRAEAHNLLTNVIHEALESFVKENLN